MGGQFVYALDDNGKLGQLSPVWLSEFRLSWAIELERLIKKRPFIEDFLNLTGRVFPRTSIIGLELDRDVMSILHTSQLHSHKNEMKKKKNNLVDR